MFSQVVQPAIVSLFSSTNSNCLQLFQVQTDQDLLEDSFIHLLNDATSSPLPKSLAKLILPSRSSDGSRIDYPLNQTVLHLQSPTLRTTFIHCPKGGRELALKHSWICIQLRSLEKECALEIELVDMLGIKGLLRLSTFQKRPRLQLHHTRPILHLPLEFPRVSSRPLTTWATISLNLPLYLSYFRSTTLRDDDSSELQSSVLPSAPYSHISYVRIYANCRLRRIWVSRNSPAEKLPWEFELYGES